MEKTEDFVNIFSSKERVQELQTEQDKLGAYSVRRREPARSGRWCLCVNSRLGTVRPTDRGQFELHRARTGEAVLTCEACVTEMSVSRACH
jgi:hypothetical protein